MEIKYIPDWEIDNKETSNNCYEYNAIRKSGNVISFQGGDSNNEIIKLEIEIIKMEQTISTDFTLFIFQYLSNKLIANNQNIYKQYNPEAFGSWYIDLKDKRLIYDGKDDCFIIQNKMSNDTFDEIKNIKNEVITENIIYNLYKDMTGSSSNTAL